MSQNQKMEWRSFKALFEVSPNEESPDEDGDRNFSADDIRENSEISADRIVHDWSHDETVSSDEALDSETGYKTAAPSSRSLELDDQIIEERASSCVEIGNGENESAKDLDYENEIKQHLRWFGHGKLWTLIAAGVILAFYSRYSLEFVTLDEPLLIDSVFNYVDSVGMLRIEVCYNETVVGEYGCYVIDLSPEIVSQFEAARILHTLGLLFGLLFATVLSTAIFWESINLLPIRFGLLFTYFYFCQACAMIFFDTDLCATNKCKPGAGCIYCIVASFCWITACVATAKIDPIKSGHVLRRRRQARREAKKTAKAIRKKLDREARKKLDRETFSAAEQTASTSSSNCSPHLADLK
jgi:hypothetical protein